MDVFKVIKLRRKGPKHERERDLQEGATADPKLDSENGVDESESGKAEKGEGEGEGECNEGSGAEAEDDDEDFIMNEVKRRLKELRRNSFMVLIPEEDPCAEEDDDDEDEEEEEGGETEQEWRDVEAEGRQWWGGFGAVYDDYCERMLFYDRMSMQPLIEPGSETPPHSHSHPPSPRSRSRSKSASKKAASPLRCLSLKRIEEPPEDEDGTEHLHPPLPSIDSYHHIETAYVAHICLSWEALHCQYTQLNHLISCQPQPQNPFHYNLTAQQFQQFQVLLQRFIEDEPFQQSPRPRIYAQTRRSFPKMLHVPNIQGSDPKGVQEEESDSVVLAPDLILIIEAAIFTFHRFLKMDKKSSNSGFGNHAQDAARIRSLLYKKKAKLKEARKKSRGLKQKTWPQTYEDMQLLLGVVDIKIISRLVKMSRITKEQLVWCEEKLNKLDVSDGRLRRDPSPLLFPC